MFMRKTPRALACGFGCFLLANCAEFADRYGPDPVLQEVEVSDTVRRHSDIINTFYDASGIPPTWFGAAEVGMNYVDEKCDTYMRDLFIINRRKGRIDSILKAMDKSSNAVGTAASASKLALLALGQSFGLAEAINDSVLQSYLFEQIPGVVADKVRAGRMAYRSEIEKPENRKTVITQPIAFKVVRNYLSLCMPQTIEGKFLDTYVSSTPVAKTPPTTGSAGNLLPPKKGDNNIDVQNVTIGH
jgi:hypothetical protein